VQPAPTRIAPVFRARIWGSRSLAPLYPDQVNLPEPVGEAWLTAVDCPIASGPYEGKFLGAAWREMPETWRGSALARVPEFPILVKFIFPADKLSIQVHPDDAYASANEQAAGGRGKTEMWHAVSAEPGAKVLIGLKSGTTREDFLNALESQAVENLFEAYAVNPGDTFFIPAGTPHAIGPGMVLCEIQEYSDLTYRVYDYGRVDAHGNPRELHIEKALDVTDFAQTAKGADVLKPRTDFAASRLLVACNFFSAERQDFSAAVYFESDPARFEVIVIICGAGTIDWQDRQFGYHPGECWFIPATLGNYSLHPTEATSIIRSTVPDLAELRNKLQKKGMANQEIASVLFS
jgi:mannose-6-phosphate isomerase